MVRLSVTVAALAAMLSPIPGWAISMRPDSALTAHPTEAHVILRRRHDRRVPFGSRTPRIGRRAVPAYGNGQDPRPNGGFTVDQYGNGNYTRGSNGGFGGYPAGSAGAEELMNNQQKKCDFAPRTC